MVLRTLATGESPDGGAVDGMFVARTHGQDLPGAAIDLAIDEPEPGRPSAGDVELDSSQSGEIAAHMAQAEVLAAHPAVSQIVDDRRGGGNDLWPVGPQSGHIV